MKLYPYNGQHYTILELEEHPDCKVAGHELRRNLWRYKMQPKEAMTTRIKSRRSRCKDTYPYMGIQMTTFELMELEECKVSYNVLRRLLRNGVPVEYALRNEEPPEREIPIDAPPLPLPPPGYEKAEGSQISFNPPFVRIGREFTYEWLVMNRTNKYVMNNEGINLTATLDKTIE